MTKIKIFDSNGNTIIQVVIAMGMAMVVGLSVATMMQDQNKQVRAMSEKMLSKEVESSMKNVFSDSNYCSCIFRNQTFDTTTSVWSTGINQVPVSFTSIPTLPAACTSSSTNIVPTVGSLLNAEVKMTVASINLVNMTETTPGSGNYTGDVEVGFNNTIRALHSVKTNIAFSVDMASGSPSARPFKSCHSMSTMAFGGMYQVCDITSCGYNNPLTGARNCPPGYTANAVGRAKWPDGSGEGSMIYGCYSNTMPFGGTFQNCDITGCGYNNPITGARSCPPGFTTTQIARVKWPDGSGEGSNIYGCY